MSVYLVSLVLGAAGLLGMAATGLGRHGHGGGGGSHGGHGGHGGHGSGHAAVHSGHHGGGSGAHGAGHGGTSAAMWLLMTPRFLFALLLGFGLAGVLLQSVLGGTLLLILAIVGAVVVERALVNP
ncbi:MAG: hypothetical protein ACREK8_10735, partial [Gemmatimonadales bacterium]